MAYVQIPFTPDIPGSIVVPAHADNVRPGVNNPRINVFHTPEERADDIEVTPYYFSRRIYDAQGNQRRASTTNYADSDGDLFQMVPDKYGAIANGLRGMSQPAGTLSNVSLNLQSRSIEIEGFAHNIHLTCVRGGPQWNTVVRWTLAGNQMHGIPLDRAHNLGHKEIANNRSDPGGLDIDAIVEDAITLLAKQNEPEEEDMAQLIRERSSGFVFTLAGVFYSYLERIEHATDVGTSTQINVVPDGTLGSYVRADMGWLANV